MRVLVACEFSGKVREAFRAKGHDTWSCDLEGAWDRSPYHYQTDVRNIIDDGWDLMIGHPPCTYLSNSGNRWLKEIPKKKARNGKYGEDRLKAMHDAAEFFKFLLNSKIPKVALENPIMHGEAIKIIGAKYDQLIQPHDFGHGEVKSTCLWLKQLPKLKPTNKVKGRFPRTHLLGFERVDGICHSRKMAQKLRSITYDGIAQAFAEQWG